MDQAEADFFSKPKKLIGQAITRKRKRTAQKDSNSDSESSSDSDSSTVSNDTTKKHSGPKTGSNEYNTDVINQSSVKPKSPLRSRRTRNDTHTIRDSPPRRSDRRSASLTPPPELPANRLAASTQLISDTLFAPIVTRPIIAPTHPSSDFQPDDSEILFEQQMRERMAGKSTTPQDQDGVHQPIPHLISASPPTDQQDPTLASPPPPPPIPFEVIVQGVYVKFTTDNEGTHADTPPDPTKWETPVRYKLTYTTPLSVPKIAFCRNSNFCDGDGTFTPYWRARTDDIVLVWRGVRVFDYISAKGLGMDVDEVPVLEAHTKRGFAFLQANPLERDRYRVPVSVLPGLGDAVARGGDLVGDGGDSAGGEGGTNNEEETTRETVQNNDNQLKTLYLRGPQGTQLTVRAKQQTKISALMRGFKERHGAIIPAGDRIRLFFEGEELSENDRVGETELEDGEQIDVKVGL